MFIDFLMSVRKTSHFSPQANAFKTLESVFLVEDAVLASEDSDRADWDRELFSASSRLNEENDFGVTSVSSTTHRSLADC